MQIENVQEYKWKKAYNEIEMQKGGNENSDVCTKSSSQ